MSTFRKFLDEQMEDPEFAKAYGEISAKVDKEIATQPCSFDGIVGEHECERDKRFYFEDAPPIIKGNI